MKIDTGVVGGAPNLLGSLTAAARPFAEGVDWQAFGTSHTPENCGHAWPWQACSVAGREAVWTLVLVGDEGSTFVLTFLGEDTADVFDMDAAAFLAALEALPNVDPGDFTVTGDPNDWTITATDTGQYANTSLLGAFEGDGGGGLIGVATSVALIQEVVGTPLKPLNAGSDPYTFAPFLVEYNSQACDAGSIPNNWDELEARAKRGLQVRAGTIIAEVLSSSEVHGDPNDSPNLPTAATVVNPDAVGLQCALAKLIEAAYAAGATGELFFHAPAWALPAFLSETQIVQVGNVWKLGPHTVVLDAGFSNEAPTAGGEDAEPGQAWIYVSGPVEVATGQVQVAPDTARGVSQRLNQANVIAAELAIYRFDPCAVNAALVDICVTAEA